MDADEPTAATGAGRRIGLLGGEVDAVTPGEVMAFTARRVAEGRRGLVANHNLHSLSLLRREAAMRGFYAMADVIEADSMPLIAWGRLLGRPIGRRHRSTYLDWREDFWRLAAREGWRVFYLGGRPGVAAKGAEAVRRRWPGARIAVRHGHFDVTPGGADNAAVLAEIAAHAPDVLFVGMGMPRQEAWIIANYPALPQAVVFSIGAAFDYEAGALPTPAALDGAAGAGVAVPPDERAAAAVLPLPHRAVEPDRRGPGGRARRQELRPNEKAPEARPGACSIRDWLKDQPARFHRIGMRTVPPATGCPSCIFGFIRKVCASFSDASPKSKSGGSSLTTLQPVSVPFSVTVQEMVARPLLLRLWARGG